MQTKDKKASFDEVAWQWLARVTAKIWRKVVCAIGAAMSIGFLIIMAKDGLVQALLAMDVMNMLSRSVMILAPLLLAVFAIIHIFKPLPRLLMLFAGIAVFLGAELVVETLTSALLLAGAGLLVFASEASRQTVLLCDEPRKKQKGVMLIIAGVLALVWVGYQVYRAVISIQSMVGYSDGMTYAFFVGLINAVGGICIAITCFMKNRPTSVFYRMFFTGAVAAFLMYSWLSCVQFLINIEQMQAVTETAVPVMSYVHYFGNAALQTAITVLVVLHAILSRPRKAKCSAEAEAVAEAAEEAAADVTEE